MGFKCVSCIPQIKVVLFEQFLISTAVQLGEHRRQRAVIDTSLTDIIEEHRTINVECVGLSVSQYYLQKS